MNKFISKINLIGQKSKGFSTLFVVIVLGSISLSLTLLLTISSTWSIRGSLNSKTSNLVKSINNACAEVALEQMRENNAYIGTSTVTLGGNTCNYTVSNTGGSNRSVSITSTVNNLTRNLEITTSSFNPIVISSWQEVP